MMPKEKEPLAVRVERAQQDTAAADRLIEEYTPFIKSETAKFLKAPVTGHEDEYSVAMLAFYEAVMAYSEKRGTFTAFASMHIRSRLIDHYRKERRHRGQVSLEEEIEDGVSHKDTLADDRAVFETRELREATRQEIAEYAAQLAAFGLDLSAVSEQCPKQERTLAACREVLYYARRYPEIPEELLETHKLPVARLIQSGVSRKTIERHRRYIVALLLAYTNGFEIIRGHIACVLKKEGK